MEVHSISYENLNILIVEDDDCNYLLLQEFLSEYKFNLLRAKNGRTALGYVESCTPLHLVILDIKLSLDLDGISLGKIIREKRPDLRIIIQSAALLDNIQKRRIKELNCDYLPKPLDLDEFIRVIFSNLEYSFRQEEDKKLSDTHKV